MSPMQCQWNDLCVRLGVKPKQFATLLAVLVVSVGGLSLKAMVGTRKAAASVAAAPVAAEKATAKSQPAQPTRSAAPATAQKGGKSPKGASASTPGVRRVIECSLESVPARDPFRAWGLPEPVATSVPETRPVTGGEPGVLPGLPLRAVLRGELAVFGDQTVRPGESVSLPDGSFARIRVIGDRNVAVEWNGRTVDVMFGAGSGAAKAPAAGGFK